MTSILSKPARLQATYPAHMRWENNRLVDSGQPQNPHFGAGGCILELSAQGTLVGLSHRPLLPMFSSFPLRRQRSRANLKRLIDNVTWQKPAQQGEFISGVGRRGGRVAPGRDSTVGPRPNFSGSGNPSKESPLQKHKLDAVWVPPVPHIFQSTAESLAGGPRFISRQRLVDCFGVGTLTIPADHRPLFTHNLEER